MSLSKKILITEKFYDVVNEPNSICKKINNGKLYDIQGEVVSVEELLKTLVLVSHVCPEDISMNSVLKLIKIKKDLEEVQIKENITNKGTEIITKNEALNIEKRSEIILLKKQKENLINQKKKTEQMLNVLKKYMRLKENFFKNKQKYKSILFILNKMRQKNLEQNNDNNTNGSTEDSIDKIEQLLECEDIDNYNINLKEISNEEKEELNNFEVSETLLKDIETCLMQKIKKLFEEEKKEDNNKDENKVNKINTEDTEKINFNKLGIEREVNLNIFGNSFNIEGEDQK